MPAPRYSRREIAKQQRRIRRRIRRRKTRKQRVRSIYRRIYESTGRNKPLTMREIARAERLSLARIRFYIRLIRKAQRRKGILIKVRHFGKKRVLIYENVARKEAGFVRQQRGEWELRGSVKYSQAPQRGLQIEMMILIPSRDLATIHRGIQQINEILKDHNFAGLVDEMEFGTVPASSLSRPFFKYKHKGEDWTTVW